MFFSRFQTRLGRRSDVRTGARAGRARWAIVGRRQQRTERGAARPGAANAGAQRVQVPQQRDLRRAAQRVHRLGDGHQDQRGRQTQPLRGPQRRTGGLVAHASAPLPLRIGLRSHLSLPPQSPHSSAFVRSSIHFILDFFFFLFFFSYDQ